MDFKTSAATAPGGGLYDYVREVRSWVQLHDSATLEQLESIVWTGEHPKAEDM